MIFAVFCALLVFLLFVKLIFFIIYLWCLCSIGLLDFLLRGDFMKKTLKISAYAAMFTSALVMISAEAHAGFPRGSSIWTRLWCPSDKVVESINPDTSIRVRHNKILSSGVVNGDDFCTKDNTVDVMVNANLFYNRLVRGENPENIRRASSLGKAVYNEWVRNGKPIFSSK